MIHTCMSHVVCLQAQFLKKAVDILCRCRQTLRYTYAFAYYLKKNNHTELFQDNQRDLEMATEKLSEYLERDISHATIADIKVLVQDKSRLEPYPPPLPCWLPWRLYGDVCAGIVNRDVECCWITCLKATTWTCGSSQNTSHRHPSSSTVLIIIMTLIFILLLVARCRAIS